MKVLSVSTHVVRVPLHEPTSVSRGLLRALNCVVLSITCDADIVGYGSVEPLGVGAFGPDTLAAELAGELTSQLTPALLGLEIEDEKACAAVLDRHANASLVIRALADMAMADARANGLGKPLHALLGRQVHDTVDLVGWIGKVGIAATVAKARERVDYGFKALKIKIGRPEGDDLERIAAVRDAVGPNIELRVDANGKFAPEDAISLIRRMQKYDLAYCEQPSGRGADFSALATIRRAVDMPILADEGVSTPGDIERLHKTGAADLIKTRLMKQGGIQPTLEMIQCAESFGIGCILGHGFGLIPSTFAELHVAAVSPNVRQPCEMVGPLKFTTDVATTPLNVSGGAARVPSSPGLGISVAIENLERLRAESVRVG